MLSGCDVLLLVAIVPSMSRPFVKSSVSGLCHSLFLRLGLVVTWRMTELCKYFSDRRWLLV